MRGAVTGLAGMLMLLSAFALYAVSYESRRLELGVQERERRLERLRSEIAVLKADRAFLSRPSRLEAAANRLGMRSATAQQTIQIEEIPLRPAAAADSVARSGGP